jgi:nicotinate phosphoribosyltransferase
MITSLLDTDLYKFTGQQFFFNHFRNATAKYKFKCRNKDVDLSPYMGEIKEEIETLNGLSLKVDELGFLGSLPYFNYKYLEFLKTFKLDTKYVSYDNGITIKGPLVETTMFEIPILSIVNEVYFKNTAKTIFKDGLKILAQKINFATNMGFRFTDFGTRRRRSQDWQKVALDYIYGRKSNFLGTSNVMFSKYFGIPPIGTQAHEHIQVFQSKYSIQDSQREAFLQWYADYNPNLLIALSDTLGMECFFKDFEFSLATKYDGARHDSGDPYVWCKWLIDHYKSLGIDPKTKKAVFSDNLTFEKAADLHKEFSERINVMFGIGTNLMNDFGDTPLNIVIKLVEVNGYPVAKISDEPGKTMCESKEYTQYLKYLIDKKLSI